MDTWSVPNEFRARRTHARVAFGESVRLKAQATSGWRFVGGHGACKVVGLRVVIRLRTAQRRSRVFVGGGPAAARTGVGCGTYGFDFERWQLSRGERVATTSISQACGSFQAAYAALTAATSSASSRQLHLADDRFEPKVLQPDPQVTFTSVPGRGLRHKALSACPRSRSAPAYVKLDCMNANPSGTNRCVDVSGSSHDSVVYISLDTRGLALRLLRQRPSAHHEQHLRAG